MTTTVVNEQESVVQAVYGFAAQLLKQGLTQDDIKIRLMQEGLPEDAATAVIDNLMQMQMEAKRRAGRRNMVVGALWAVGGLIVTGASYAAAGAGDRYILAWGAVVFGLVQVVRGFMQTRS